MVRMPGKLNSTAKMQSKLIAAAISGSCGLLIAGHARASTIIYDSFTGTSGASLVTHVPDTDTLSVVTGYTVNTGYTTNGGSHATLVSGTASFGGNPTYAYLPFYTTSNAPASFTVSADLTMGSTNNDTSNKRGEAIGFYGTPPATTVDTVFAPSSSGFDGLILEPNGSVELILGGNAEANVPYAGGSFSTTSTYTLGYTVDSDGSISGITLTGSTADYSSLVTAAGTSFSGTALNYIALVQSSATADYGTFDNFTVTSTPEPASLCLLGLGVPMLLVRRRRA